MSERNDRFKDLTGQVFGRLTVVADVGNDKGGRARWSCRCECGGLTEVRGDHLRNGRTASCGCAQQEARGKVNRTHGRSGTRLHRNWHSMIQRTTNPNVARYHIYGGRGIKVCDRWRNSFENFASDMGEPPTPQHSLDRINVNGNYEPGNVRWATKKEQGRNTRFNVVYEYRGKTACVVEHCEDAGISTVMVYKRLSRGWSIDDAMTLPPVPTGHKLFP